MLFWYYLWNEVEISIIIKGRAFYMLFFQAKIGNL